MRFLYWSLNGYMFSQLRVATGWANQTVVEYSNFFRKLCISQLEHDGVPVIGGKGVIMEIDESKFSKKIPQGSFGQRGMGIWWCRKNKRTKKFCVRVEKRTKNVLMPLIKKHIAPGSIIYSNKWKTYHSIASLDKSFKHLMVNHSKEYKNKKTDCCTNTIEGSWRRIKQNIPNQVYNLDKLDDHLLFFIWRRQNKGCIWKAVLDCTKDTKFMPLEDVKNEVDSNDDDDDNDLQVTMI